MAEAPTPRAPGAGPLVAVCLKRVARRVAVDPLTGTISADPATWGPSPADEAALEVALQLAAAWAGTTVAVGAGPPAVDEVLRGALAAGADRALRVDLPADAPSAAVALALARALQRVDVVVCGDHSLDRGSGTVPALLAAHLRARQALGAAAVRAAGPGVVEVERRLERGRREVLRASPPVVLSVDGGVARLRRASLPALLASGGAPVERVALDVPPGGWAAGLPEGPTRPARVRAHPLAGPDPASSPTARIHALTGVVAGGARARRVVHADPAAAADELLAQLAAWGHLPASPGPDGPAPGDALPDPHRPDDRLGGSHRPDDRGPDLRVPDRQPVPGDAS